MIGSKYKILNSVYGKMLNENFIKVLIKEIIGLLLIDNPIPNPVNIKMIILVPKIKNIIPIHIITKTKKHNKIFLVLFLYFSFILFEIFFCFLYIYLCNCIFLQEMLNEFYKKCILTIMHKKSKKKIV